MPFPKSASPCTVLNSEYFSAHKVWVKRDDLLHAQVSGNKFRKLKYPLLSLQGRRTTLVSMGGPWSNHLHALAHAGQMLRCPTISLVRGASQVNTATLDDCRQLGMSIQFLTREDYRHLRNDPEARHRHLQDLDTGADHVWLPEGGSTPEALRGVAEIIDELINELDFVPDTVVVACGTGATLAGLLAGLQGRGRVIGIAVLKNADYLHDDIAQLLRQAGYPEYKNYELLTGYHHGGYGKAPAELSQFCRDFTQKCSVPVEPVYTGKMFYALKHLAQMGKFRADERIVALHTGGMQGARGFTE